ncbi:MAG TPA: hypothetical protein VLD67_14150 [Vicinamibacterales bacterium]|nr:hypothetical protein [Vicinamibacterales bacterium]
MSDLGAGPPPEMSTMEAVRRGSMAARRFMLLLMGLFGLLSLGLAALGDKRQEIGARS